MIVTLSPSEMMTSGTVGLQRHVANVARNRTDQHGAPVGSVDPHVIGAMGEMAVAKSLGVFWSGSSDFSTRNAGDLPGSVEVRTTTHAAGRLIVHESDPDDRRYILVVATLPTFDVVGWCYGRDAKQPEHWADPTGNNRPAFFTPRTALRPMAEWSAPVDPLHAQGAA